MPTIVCLNGPNLNRLGERDPAIYGHTTLGELEGKVRVWGDDLGYDVIFRQSNHEGELIEAIHAVDGDQGVIINPGAFTHSSPALGDAIEACPAPVVEVHLSNVRRRERWRRRSFVSEPAVRSIIGRGPEGYRAALRHLSNRTAWPTRTVVYGPHPDHTIELREVDQATAGVILIHGGFWDDAWAADTVESWAVDLARRGLPSANIEYRRVGSGGGARATTVDVLDSIDAAKTALGLTTVAVVGHSSGGHLAAWAAVSADDAPAVTVAVSGILDLEMAHVDGFDHGAVGRFDPGHMTSPARAGAPRSPIALVHGKDDTVVPPSQSTSYAADRSLVEVDLVPGRHFDALDPTSVAWQTVVKHLEEHLR